MYGVNTGFGLLASERIAPGDLRALQRNLIVSHAAGVGAPLPIEIVRAAMLLRANVLLRGTSGVRSVVVDRLVAMLNAGIHPVVPEQGSVGASGDLAPLAHIALALIGDGVVIVGYDASVPSTGSGDALRAAGIEPVVLEAKEGLAFINGTQVQTAVLALLLHDARNLWRTAVGAAAMSVEALLGTPVPFEARIHEVRPHPGQVEAARLLREALADSEIRDSHRDDDPRVQDAYSLRCTPQVLGSVLDALDFAQRTTEIELNASTDNPLLFDDEVVSGGNFHGQPIAQALDVVTMALTTLAGLSERRLERLVNPQLSQGMPAFLAQRPGLESGLMMAQITAAALVAESRTLATPASVQSIPTDGNQEDFVPMGMAAAFKARRVLANAQRVVSCELLAGAEGLEYRKPLAPGVGVRAVYDRVRAVVPPAEGDRILTPLIEALTTLIGKEALL
jgi:histidine ammonia-lyase